MNLKSSQSAQSLLLTADIAPGQGRSQGGKRGEISPPPRNRKNCCRKMVLFPKALFLVTNFRKNKKIKIKKNKKINFYIEFSSKNFKIFSKFPINLGFSSKRAKN